MRGTASLLLPLLIVGTASGGASPAVAQTRQRLPLQAACPHCTISQRHLLTIGTGPDTTGLSGKARSIAVDSKGRYYVTQELPGELPRIYDSSGAFLQTLGHIGDGPGEYREPGLLAITAGDTVHVLDLLSGRHTVLDPRRRPVRSGIGPQAAQSILPLPSGQLLVNADVRDPGQIGFPVHLLDRHDRILRSFGAEAPTVGRRSGPYQRRALAAGPDGTVWLAPWLRRYELEQWTLDGRFVAGLVRDVSWFAPYEEFLPPTPNRPIQPAIDGIWFDSAGRLWVMLRVSDPRYPDGFGPARATEGVRHFPVLDNDLIADTILEVIDPLKGRVIVSQRLPHFFSIVVGPGLIARNTTMPNGLPVVDIWRVSLVEQ